LKVLEEWVRIGVEEGAHDVYLEAGQPVWARCSGALRRIHGSPLPAGVVQQMLHELVPLPRSAPSGPHAFDIASTVVRAYASGMGTQCGVALRLHAVHDSSPGALRLPPALVSAVATPGGIAILAGAAGSGRTLAAASLVRFALDTAPRHVALLDVSGELGLLVGHPALCASQSGRGLVASRSPAPDEIDLAVRHALTMGADALVIDAGLATLPSSTLLQLATCRASSVVVMQAQGVVDAACRLVQQVRRDIDIAAARALCAALEVVSHQHLLPAPNPPGLRRASELLVLSQSLREAVLADAHSEIERVLREEDSLLGSRSLDQDLFEMVSAGLVRYEDAVANCRDPGALTLKLATFSGSPGLR
jgi:Tfp pilus assembly pilus retraction ATPase PilT